MDRISNLPQPILHHILSFLSQREAIQTCVLSKSWRYRGSTRPYFEFRERCFNADKETFLSVMDKILHRYHDQKISVQKFLVEMSMVDSESISFLEKWIPLVILNKGVNTFILNFLSYTSAHFALPSIVYKAEFLKELNLKRCKLSQLNPLDEVLFKHLQKLSLTYVYIADETFEKIMSSCPLIEYVNLEGCEGLKNIKVNKAHKLKNFDFDDYLISKEEDGLSIEIDAPTIESISIMGRTNWFHHHKNFPYLKYLHLENVRLSTKSFDNFSFDYPCLEELELLFCHGFEEFRLLSRSIKHLTIAVDRSIKAAIDATNILHFGFISNFLPSISFRTTSSKWKSRIHLMDYVDVHYDASSSFLKLNELVKALSRSEISLHIEDHPLVVPDTYTGFNKPVVVENLIFGGHSSSSFPTFLNCLFHICRPKKIGDESFLVEEIEWEREDEQRAEFLCKNLLMEREMRRYFWQQDLEEVSMEAFDRNGRKWHPVQGTSLPECALPNNQLKQNLRFRLKWRELSYLAFT
ncbi:hypothetical protein DH2020_004918 [Rehmannia glutinosa]|uniref:F-box domain-containing protein n=1 Tax=Rehmannia glutinosa TaxID=99300 RepID=A0ABR0XQU3_REHGL